MAGKKNDIDFEKSLGELEQLVETMEKGDLSLEESLKKFERGVALTRACQKALAQAEQRVQILARDNDAEELTPFEESGGEGGEGGGAAKANAAPAGKKAAPGDDEIPF